MKVKPFFDYARARHQVYLNRAAGMPQEDWTKDPILKKYRFTNVFRELDKTTVWFKKFAREPMRNDPVKVLLATVVFRLLNRIEVGEAIFCQTSLERGQNETAFDMFVEEGGDTRILKRAIKAALPRGPYVTGGYIITSPPGMSKLDGMMKIISMFYKSNWRDITTIHEPSLQEVWQHLKGNKFFGPFHSYEMVTDLRHTILLDRAPDIMTWANIGPGCRRGLARLIYGQKKAPKKMSEAECLERMAEILASSRSQAYWHQSSGKRKADWPAWEMREVEHTLCEYDKYCRVKNGEGRPRGVFS